jgi:exonuclease III
MVPRTSAKHEWTTHAQQTRNEARVKCSYDARMSRNVLRMLSECYVDATRMLCASRAYVAHMRHASYAPRTQIWWRIDVAAIRHLVRTFP